MERELQHFSHIHPLILKAEEGETIKCNLCFTPISGPFYSCRKCVYFSHKVCGELPKEMNHPMHSKHPLTLSKVLKFEKGRSFCCCMCGEWEQRFAYNCSICDFDVDLMCASTSYPIKDKCHQHPLIPLQHSTTFPCHICQTEKEGLSYKCNICPFWVHQNCTVSLPDTVEHIDHRHPLELLPSLPLEIVTNRFRNFCDICYRKLFSFQCIYCCVRCLFFAHITCATSNTTESSSMPRDRNIDINQDGPSLIVLPVQQKSTDIISWFVENYSNRDAITNLLMGFDENYIDQDTSMENEIKFFDHEHKLSLINDQVSNVICDACALPISTPYYGCNECGYFLHKYCTELPKEILHPIHPNHPISLCNAIFTCQWCTQWSNGFGYKCLKCRDFIIDIKCVSLLRQVKYKTHRHPLIPKFIAPFRCSGCGGVTGGSLQCATCSFCLCFECAMLPPNMKHRYDKHPFLLTYSPPENYYNNKYICDLCERDLHPKHWFYHCGHCEQFTHTFCMISRVADSNIKYMKSYKYEDHEHNLALISCTYNSSLCNKCHLPMRTGYSVGLECEPCNFQIHLECAFFVPSSLPN